MRQLLVNCIIVIIVLGCNKQDNNSNGGTTNTINDFTPIPPAENVNTEIIGHITYDNTQVFTGSNQFQIKNTNSTSYFTLQGNGMVYTGPVSTDKLMTRSKVELYIPTGKTFAVSSAIKNYVRIKNQNTILSGYLRNDAGGVIPFGNTGSITYGINNYYLLPFGTSLGYFGPELTCSVHTTYYNPEDKEFAVRLPCYLASDNEGQRWFLKSYGVVSFVMSSNSLYNENIDFFAGRTAEVKMPIPVSMQLNAPDSIATWQLNNGVWIKNGWAIKQGNFYKASIGKTGTWNFALPVKGVYLTVNLRTDSSATVTNTAVRIKQNSRPVAESQTDANGNAVCFVPSNETLEAEIVPDYRTDIRNSSFTFPLAPVNKAGAVTIKLAESTTDLSMITGNVLNCNNEPVSSGVVKITMSDANRDYYIPFTNGKFATAVWISGLNVGVNNAKIQVTDNAGNQGDITLMSLARNRTQYPNFYTCTNSPLLYCNFSIDKIRYEFKDNAKQPSPFLVMTKTTPTSPAYNMMRLTNSSNIGVNFGVFEAFAYPGIWYIGPIPDIAVNGISHNFEPGTGNTYEATLSYSRYDAAVNGYLEGYFSFYYKDNITPSLSHQVKGSFKIKKTF